MFSLFKCFLFLLERQVGGWSFSPIRLGRENDVIHHPSSKEEERNFYIFAVHIVSRWVTWKEIINSSLTTEKNWPTNNYPSLFLLKKICPSFFNHLEQTQKFGFFPLLPLFKLPAGQFMSILLLYTSYLIITWEQELDIIRTQSIGSLNTFQVLHIFQQFLSTGGGMF